MTFKKSNLVSMKGERENQLITALAHIGLLRGVHETVITGSGSDAQKCAP
jgi:hypothetical protein